MKRKALALTLVTALVFSATGLMLVSLAVANPLPAPSILKIYIRSDGTVNPSTAPIQRAGNTYTFKSDLTNSTIIVERDNVVIDGAGYKLQGNYYWWDIAVKLENRSNVIIENIDIRDYALSIQLAGSSNIIIYHNNMLTDGNINLDSSVGNQIVGNNITSYNTYGIKLEHGSSNNLIVGNSFYNAGLAVDINSGRNNTFYHNNFIGNDKNVQAYGDNVWDNGTIGNFWSDYEGTDANGDGVGDTPYPIHDCRPDRYPLMAPFDSDSLSIELPEWASTPASAEPLTVESFPTTLVAVVSGALVAVVGVGLLVYFKKRKHTKITDKV